MKTTAARTGPLVLLVLLGCGLLQGCGSSPTPRFYALQPIADEPGGSVDPHLGIRVGPIHLPRYLQRPQIVSRKGDTRLKYDELNRWAGSLESETLRVVSENLSILLGTDRMIVYPLAAPFPLAYRIRFHVDRFDGTRGEELGLRVRWVINSAIQGEAALAVETSSLTERLDGSSVEALVRAHSKVLAELSRQIATRLVELEAARETETLQVP